jgi:glucose 1-dehydrogenase
MNQVSLTPQAVMPRCAPQRWLEGQKALVTGASSGIGRAIAIALGEAGADVVVNYASGEAKAREVAAAIEAVGSRALIQQGDVSTEADVQRMFAATLRELGTIDILVNNAGLQQDAPFEELTLAQWNKVIGVNLTGQFLCARAAVREFKRRGVRPEVSSSAGKIICISSVHEVIPWAGHVNYAASKGGVMLMMKSIAQEAIRTPINMEAWGTQEAYDDLLRLIPYKRIGEADEIGRAAAWLASDYADYINGVSLFVDGGMTLYPGFETGG